MLGNRRYPRSGEADYKKFQSVIALILFNNNLNVETQIRLKIANPSGSRGMILFQEISYNFRKVPVTIWARYCLFILMTGDSRITPMKMIFFTVSVYLLLYGKGAGAILWQNGRSGIFAELRIKYWDNFISYNRKVFGECRKKLKCSSGFGSDYVLQSCTSLVFCPLSFILFLPFSSSPIHLFIIYLLSGVLISLTFSWQISVPPELIHLQWLTDIKWIPSFNILQNG